MRLSAERLVNSRQSSRSVLTEQRAATDQTLVQFQNITSRIKHEYTSPDYLVAAADLQTRLGALPALRVAVDDRSISVEEATHQYGDMLLGIGVDHLATADPHSEPAVAAGLASEFLRASNQLAEANALSTAAFTKSGLSA